MEKILNILNSKLAAANKQHTVPADFKKLQTDQDRIIFTLKIMLEYNIIPNLTGAQKSTSESEKLREQGNKVFVTNSDNATSSASARCLEAFKLYTKSIAHAPYPSKQLALAFANRSAVLFEMQKYMECVQDIDRALNLEYPENLKAKLYVRKTECLVALGMPLAEDTYKEATLLLDKMALSESSKKLRAKLESAYNKSKVKKKPVKKEQSESPLPALKTQNPEVPCASTAIAIKYNEMYGRHIVATRKINPGELIVVEKPYSLLLSPKNIHTHCSNCLKVSWANIPCDYCTYSMYCSKKCKVAEWKKYHDVECPVFPPLLDFEFTKLDLLCMRMAVQAVREATSLEDLKADLKEVDECNDPRTKGFSSDGKLHSNKYRSIYSLVTNTEKRTVSDLFRRSMDACYILYLLATRTTMFGSKLNGLPDLIENDFVTFVGGLILRHQQIIPSNAHSFSEVYGLECVERGVAAMPFLSLINHSCNSNILRHSQSDRILMYTLYPIEKDEQIFDSYGQYYALTPKATRQAKLLKQYHFKCECIACQQDWPLYFSLKSYNDLVTKSSDRAKITNALRKFNAYVDLATEGNVADKPYIIKDLLTMIQVLYDCVPMPCEEMSNVVETLKRVYALSGNKFEVPKV